MPRSARHLFVLLASLACSAAQAGEAAPQAVIGKLYAGPQDATGQQTVSRRLEQTAAGPRWPFAAPEAHVACVLALPQETLVLVIGGRPYALNEATRKSASAKHLQLDVGPERLDVDASTGPHVWRLMDAEDPTLPRSMAYVIEAASRIGCLHKGATGGIE